MTLNTTGIPPEKTMESKLTPLLREGINTIKMIFFKELKEHLVAKHSQRDATFINRLTGAVVNELFGTPNQEEPFASFARQNHETIHRELGEVAGEMEKMRIPLTDALRTGFLCDAREGIEDDSVIRRAAELGILITERELPMPNSFIELVRKLGESYGLIIPPAPPEQIQ